MCIYIVIILHLVCIYNEKLYAYVRMYVYIYFPVHAAPPMCLFDGGNVRVNEIEGEVMVSIRVGGSNFERTFSCSVETIPQSAEGTYYCMTICMHAHTLQYTYVYILGSFYCK